MRVAACLAVEEVGSKCYASFSRHRVLLCHWPGFEKNPPEPDVFLEVPDGRLCDRSRTQNRRLWFHALSLLWPCWKMYSMYLSKAVSSDVTSASLRRCFFAQAANSSASWPEIAAEAFEIDCSFRAYLYPPSLPCLAAARRPASGPAPSLCFRRPLTGIIAWEREQQSPSVTEHVIIRFTPTPRSFAFPR